MLSKSGIIYTFKSPQKPPQYTVEVPIPANNPTMQQFNNEAMKQSEDDTLSVSYDATPVAAMLQLEPPVTEPLTIHEGDSDTPPASPTVQTHADVVTSAQETQNRAPKPMPVVHIPKMYDIPAGKPTTHPTSSRQGREAQLSTTDKPVVVRRSRFPKRFLGVSLVLIAAAGMSIPLIPKATLETRYQVSKIQNAVIKEEQATLPSSVPLVFIPLVGPDGKVITPVNTDFSIVIPKLGINSTVIPGVDPLNANEYTAALEIGVAQSKTSYFPDQDGAVYLFSHSTNYAWYVKDLNAVFYQIKDLQPGETIIVFYKGKRYTYRFVNKTVVAPSDASYLLPITGKKMLILQTCWPPGSTTERLLIFADLVAEPGIQI